MESSGGQNDLEPILKQSVTATGQNTPMRSLMVSNYSSPFQSPGMDRSFQNRWEAFVHNMPFWICSPNVPDDEAATWVTVFGYDLSQTNFVLQYFTRLGTVEKYVVSMRLCFLLNSICILTYFLKFQISNGGNWMNIKYANKIQAKCALNRNGRVLSGKFMIGVRRCTELVGLPLLHSFVWNTSV